MELLRKFPVNDKGRDFVVGDIHGHYDLLMEGLEARGFDRETDRVFSCGDLVDRGPKNQKTLALIREPWFHAVRGNHEDMMIEDQLHAAGWGWFRAYGKWVRDETYRKDGLLKSEVRALIVEASRLPRAIEVTGKDGSVYRS